MPVVNYAALGGMEKRDNCRMEVSYLLSSVLVPPLLI